MTISQPDDLRDIANLGLTLAEEKLLLAGLQQEIVAAQARDHAVRRPDCRRCGLVCRVNDYRDHQVAALLGQVTVRLPRFRCGGRVRTFPIVVRDGRAYLTRLPSPAKSPICVTGIRTFTGTGEQP